MKGNDMKLMFNSAKFSSQLFASRSSDLVIAC